MVYWSCDFETITGTNETAVWAWDARKIGIPGHFTGVDIDSFMEWLEKRQGEHVYFHNLKFDGEFIICWLLKNGYEHTIEKAVNEGEFSTLISDTGVFYSMRIHFLGHKKSVSISDSLKLITLTVAKIPKAFGLKEIQKGKIDYASHREAGISLDVEEMEYIHGDTEIVAQAMEIMHGQGLKKITAASCAMTEYKEIIGKRMFERWFPVHPESDAIIRRAYFGGWVYTNPKYAGHTVGYGRVFDVNSHFPAQLRYQKLPYGTPRHFDGAYQENKFYPLYIQRMRFECQLKPGMLPTLKKKSFFSNSTDMLERTEGQQIEMCLTNIDLELMREHYDIWNDEYIEGWMLRAQTGMFDEYVDKWMQKKEDAANDGNMGMKQIAKLFLNSLYGKFGKNPNGNTKTPYLKEDGSVGYTLEERPLLPPIYVALAAYVTAYARKITIDSAQANIDRFLYSDTDSIHLLGKEPPVGMQLHPTKLGYWDNEYDFVTARYLHAKCYIDRKIEKDGSCSLVVKCAGMTDSQKERVHFGNFYPGLVLDGKLTPKHVKGGIVLEGTTFEIKKASPAKAREAKKGRKVRF